MRKHIITIALALVLITPALADDYGTNWMAEMITAAMSGDTEYGEYCEAQRNAKIDALGLDYPKVTFAEVLAGYIASQQPIYPDYMTLMIEAAVVGDMTAGREYEQMRAEKIAALGLDYTLVAFEELFLVSKIVYAEAGSYWLSDEHQRLVASVVLNRVASPEFPDTIAEVLSQPGQYYGANSRYFNNLRPDERAVRNALYVLENGSQAPDSVVFQSNYSWLGGGVWKSIPDRYLGTSYFNYSYYPGLYE